MMKALLNAMLSSGIPQGYPIVVLPTLLLLQSGTETIHLQINNEISSESTTTNRILDILGEVQRNIVKIRPAVELVKGIRR